MGWLIFIDILLIIVLALMLSVTVNVHLNDETRIKIRYAGITIFSVSPEDEKHKKQKKSNFYLFITASGEDAAQAAMNYGKINWLVHTALAVLYNTVKLNVKKIDITADFTSGKTEYELSCKVKLRLGTAIGCVLWFLFRTAKLYLKINSKNANKTATAERNTKPKAEKA